VATSDAGAIHRAIEAIWRIEQAKLIAGLTRVVRDVSLAEELAQEALVAALDRWPRTGVPDRPGAWLMQTAKNRAIDLFRRNRLIERKHAELGHELELDQAEAPDPDAALDDHVGDDLLGLIFTACHPALSPEAQAALTLRLLGGLTTAEIARAFLVPEPTMAQRIVRAKRTLSEAKVPFEVPRGAAMSERLGSVLAVLYLIFNEGYSATAGEDWVRPQLCEEAMRLGRVLAGLAPQEPEVHGLVALMEIQASRFRARTGADGEPVLLARQDRTRWDRLLITRGLAAIEQARTLGRPRGPYLVAGRDRGVPRPRTHRRRHRLAAASWRSTTRTCRAVALAHHRTQPRGCAVHGLRAGRRAGGGGRADGRARAAGLPPAADRARRPAFQARPPRRGAQGVRSGCLAHPQHARTGAAAGARTGVHSELNAC
jgi:RNA polymerase sigma factor (sigma-70 family)